MKAPTLSNYPPTQRGTVELRAAGTQGSWEVATDRRRGGGRISLAPLDFRAISAAALPHLDTLCGRWLPGGRRIGREWRCGSLGGEAGGSLGVRLRGARAGAWQDFSTGEKGGDPISLAAAVFRIPQAEAARRLAAMLGIGSEGRCHG